MLAALMLVLAIGVEVAATALLPKADGFRNPLWSLAVIAGYALSI
jgi:small multidrug resistance pump